MQPGFQPLAEESALITEWRAVLSGQTVPWRGSDIRNLPETEGRRVRERLWRALAERRGMDRDRINTLATALISRRNAAAQARGYPDYRHLVIADIPVAGLETYRLAIEEFVSSVLTRLHDRRARALKARTIRPWDLPSIPALPRDTPRLPDPSSPRSIEIALLRWAMLALQDAWEQSLYAGAGSTGETWSMLWMLFLPSVDWTGLDEALVIEWQSHLALAAQPGLSLLAAAREIASLHAHLGQEPLLAHLDTGALSLDEHNVRLVSSALEDSLDTD